MPALARLPLRRPTLVQRLLNRPPVENSVVELNNHLAQAPSARLIDEHILTAIAIRYRVDLRRQYRPHLREMYAKYLEHCLRDRVLSADEVQDLAHLKLLFGLTDAVAAELYDTVAGRVYQESVAEAVADGRLTEEERQGLAALQSSLRLSPDVAQRIFDDAARGRLEQVVEAAMSDERLSPDEEAEIAEIARGLGIDVAFDDRTRTLYHRMRHYWLIENGELPAVEPDIPLPEGERCYAIRDVRWHERRAPERPFTYDGVAARIRSAKAVWLGTGEVAAQSVAPGVLEYIDTGRAHLTSRRLVFTGGRTNMTIRLAAIVGFTTCQNGIEIQRRSGRSPFLEFTQDVDLFSLKLDRALSECAV